MNKHLVILLGLQYLATFAADFYLIINILT